MPEATATTAQATTEAGTGNAGGTAATTTTQQTTSGSDPTLLGGQTQATDQTGPKSDAAKGGEAKAQEPAPAIELKLPDGVEASPALEQFKTLAPKLGLKSEGAQQLVDLFLQTQAQQSEAAATQREQQSKGWIEAVKADKELGGGNLNATTKIASDAVRAFGGDELIQVLNATGLGNHPALVRAFYRAGKQLQEDSIAGTSGGPGGQKEDVWNRMYTNQAETSHAQE